MKREGESYGGNPTPKNRQRRSERAREAGGHVCGELKARDVHDGRTGVDTLTAAQVNLPVVRDDHPRRLRTVHATQVRIKPLALRRAYRVVKAMHRSSPGRDVTNRRT